MMVIISIFAQMKNLLVQTREFPVPPEWAKKREEMIKALETWFELGSEK
jgi:hypothetical protein